jgi:hypothetical protein
MTTPDVRIKIGFFNHPKTRELIAEFGAAGVNALQKIWLFAAEYRPKGILTSLTDKAIFSIMGLDGQHLDPQRDNTSLSATSNANGLLEALLKLRFLEKDKKGIYRIHDWPEHNPYAFFAPERHKRAKKAAAIKYSKTGKGKFRKPAISNAGRNAGRNAKGNPPSPAPIAGEGNRHSLNGRSVPSSEFNPGPI